MPTPNITTLTLEVLMDAYAYLLSTDSRTQGINWILGDVGMGTPSQVPFGYISVLNENQTWYSANGGQGGLAAGLDDWNMPITIHVAYESHRYANPVQANPGALHTDNPFSPANLGSVVPYQEQPGWRKGLDIIQNIKKVLRTNATIKGAATDTRVVESRPLLMEIGNQHYRVIRVAVATQQRRVRGN